MKPFEPKFTLTEIPKVELTLQEALKRTREVMSNDTGPEEKALADSVCEKYQKGDEFDFGLEKKGDIYTIKIEGVRVGSFSTREAPEFNAKQVVFIILNEKLQNKGFGKQLYIKFNEYLKETEGVRLMTDTNKTNLAADKLWGSLAREELVEELPNSSADGHKIYIFKE